MRRLITVSCALVAVACGRRERAEQGAAAATIALADVAGRWTVHAITAAGDSTIITSQIVATAGTEGWTYNLPGREPIPMRVTTDADSIITEMGPYQSALRPGLQVTTRSVVRLQNGELVGTFDAHYGSTSGDSVLTGRVHMIRAQ